ncbi:SMP-30/gluconolactonase/LRE family protein [Hephaestia sp. GCM10023244]|uniref:SMP-30/gluconolactonase/LRE family protein n=1 Tax=unclassified Hephaestia TaxID=2631281 RepID=UPI00207720B0|nr:SMP-30/gluconolactonase/LRE family protein [Hephaestia sp. MAHUQ-44]MCM8730161.1 SMP-30/gluconolactonase/LRE family protein [Hephaestia sp. MAHUQ-44]
MTVDCVWSLGATLGEGPLWVPGEAALWFVDIKQRHIHRFDPASGSRGRWQAPDQVGWVQPTADGRWLTGLKSGLHWFDPEASTFTPYLDPEPGTPDNRLNDSAVDPHGRLWFGTMDDLETAPSGRLYSLGDGPRAVPTDSTCCITNGPAVSPDGRLLYPVDTLGKTIWRHEIGTDGALGRGDILIEIEDGAGHPDGAICDAEGNIWIGLFGGWGARCYAPDGTLLRHVEFPVSNVTKIALGGPDLKTAYATTAAKGLSEDELARQPLAGGLFAFEVAIPGVPASQIRIGI